MPVYLWKGKDRHNKNKKGEMEAPSEDVVRSELTRRRITSYNVCYTKLLRNTNKSEVVVTFLAILEMVRLSLINIVQNTQTGIIRLFYL